MNVVKCNCDWASNTCKYQHKPKGSNGFIDFDPSAEWNFEACAGEPGTTETPPDTETPKPEPTGCNKDDLGANRNEDIDGVVWDCPDGTGPGATCKKSCSAPDAALGGKKSEKICECNGTRCTVRSNLKLNSFIFEKSDDINYFSGRDQLRLV